METFDQQSLTPTASCPRPRRRYVHVTRTETFSAAHRLHSPALSSAANLALYGKCNHPHFHGHNYTLHVTVRGPVDEVGSGMVVNITDLKQCVHARVLAVLDHKNLDMDVAYFKSRPSTTENLALYVWDLLEPIIPTLTADEVPLGDDGPRLYEVWIEETNSNSFRYRGE